ncbi:Heat shock factor binding protein 1 [Paragonimus heterotremus]|uniref:Heat shock factor binding protein 1 n=1 Tax=Paragonimus heterotremus TaxID=100268 RepID=A0A8J4SM76_9TREM|nr:Heat shock factor binding protein 1 [Paragonimus heterotremus]
MSLGTELIKDRSFGIPDPHTVTELSNYMQGVFQQMHDTLQQTSEKISARIEEMASKIDSLEKNVADLMTQAGVQEG